MKRPAKMTAVVLALTVLAPVLPQASAEAAGPPTTVNVIHKGRTLTIPLVALPWHLLHGDTLPCLPTDC